MLDSYPKKGLVLFNPEFDPFWKWGKQLVSIFVGKFCDPEWMILNDLNKVLNHLFDASSRLAVKSLSLNKAGRFSFNGFWTL